MATSPRIVDEATAEARIADGSAWREFCRALETAGDLVLSRAPGHPIDRAEGLRYVTRLARMAFKLCLEHGDPSAPRLIQYMDPTQKFGVDNPDQLYQWARISADYDYRLSGARGTVSYIGIGVYGGSAGGGGRRTIAHTNSTKLTPGPGGRIDVVLSAKPQSGAWIRLEPGTTTVIVRQTRNDVDGEVLADLTLERIDAPPFPPPLTSLQVAKGLERAARQILGTISVFADLSDRWRERPNYLHPSDVKMAEQSFGDPDIYYMGGYWKLADDEALVIDFTPPRCTYWGFLLCNYWTESLEYRYRRVSTNKHRARYRKDGSVRIVIAHEDPQLPDVDWMDTEGHREGTMTLRWLLSETTPVPSPRVVQWRDLARE
jgi:hypothetical protein